MVFLCQAVMVCVDLYSIRQPLCNRYVERRALEAVHFDGNAEKSADIGRHCSSS
jgi:hypothetical protein